MDVLTEFLDEHRESDPPMQELIDEAADNADHPLNKDGKFGTNKETRTQIAHPETSYPKALPAPGLYFHGRLRNRRRYDSMHQVRIHDRSLVVV